MEPHGGDSILFWSEAASHQCVDDERQEPRYSLRDCAGSTSAGSVNPARMYYVRTGENLKKKKKNACRLFCFFVFLFFLGGWVMND